MEYRFAPFEERTKDESGRAVPWGHVHKDQSRNPRRPPEEIGPFGKRRSARYHNARSQGRTGTPGKRENQNVAEFSRLFSLQQESERTQGGGGGSSLTKPTTSTGQDSLRKQAERVATECILYGYRSKESEWKAIDKYERISAGVICEDYPRNDPKSPGNCSQLLSGGGDVVIRTNLTLDANRKAKRYAGGFHWIKVTFNSAEAADRACFFSPQEIDEHLVFCELFDGHGPRNDIPIRKDMPAPAWAVPKTSRSLSTSHSAAFPPGRQPQQQLGGPSESAHLPSWSPSIKGLTNVAGAHVDVTFDERDSLNGSTATASSATATGAEYSQHSAQSTLHRHTQQTKPESEFMTHIPTVRKTKLRPISDALPPQPTMAERVLRSIPILSWFTGDIVGDGPLLREDGSFDYERSNMYWRFWYMVDRVLGTDICGLREES